MGECGAGGRHGHIRLGAPAAAARRASRCRPAADSREVRAWQLAAIGLLIPGIHTLCAWQWWLENMVPLFAGRQQRWAAGSWCVQCNVSQASHSLADEEPTFATLHTSLAQHSPHETNAQPPHCRSLLCADFISGAESTGVLPSSSYRLGVRAAPLHELYSPDVTSALRQVTTRISGASRRDLSSASAVLMSVSTHRLHVRCAQCCQLFEAWLLAGTATV